GEADLTQVLPYETIQRMVATGRFTDITFMQSSKAVFPINTASGPTADLNFRKAVQAAMNAEEIMTAGNPGTYVLDPSLLFSNSPYYNAKNVEDLFNIDDDELAKTYLAQSSYAGE